MISDSICSGPVWRRCPLSPPTGCCHRRSTWLCSGVRGSGRASGPRRTGGWPAWLPPAPPPSSPAAALPGTNTREPHICTAAPTQSRRRRLTLPCQTHVSFQLPDGFMEVSRSPAPPQCVANQCAGVLSRSGRQIFHDQHTFNVTNVKI